MKKILIVDDEIQILKSLNRLFLDTDYEVDIAESGAQALEKLAQEEFDLVISDMRMPNMDGNTFLNKVKELYPKILRVILSGYADEKQVFKSLQNNTAKLYLYKPWNNESFINMINHIFETEGILLEKKLLEIFNNIEELPTIKASYQKIIQLIENEADFSEITKEIEKDQAISTKLLHIANSAFYGLKTGSIKQAAVYIGMKNIRSLVLSTSIIDSMGINKKLESYINHQWELAFLSNRILTFIYEKILGKKLLEETNSAGLLHNIGVVFMINIHKDEYLKLRDVAMKSGREFEEVEREVFGVSHQEIGGYLLRWWELPYPIVEAALFHHSPMDEKVVNKEIVAAVHLAQYEAARLLKEGSANSFNPAVLEFLKIDLEDFEEKLEKYELK